MYICMVADSPIVKKYLVESMVASAAHEQIRILHRVTKDDTGWYRAPQGGKVYSYYMCRSFPLLCRSSSPTKPHQYRCSAFVECRFSVSANTWMAVRQGEAGRGTLSRMQYPTEPCIAVDSGQQCRMLHMYNVGNKCVCSGQNQAHTSTF